MKRLIAISRQSPFPPFDPAVVRPLASPSRSSLPVLPTPSGGALSVPGLSSNPLPSSLPAPSSSSMRSDPSPEPPILGVPGLMVASRLTQPSIAAAAFSNPRPWPAPLGVAAPLRSGRIGPSSIPPTSSVIEICAESPPMRETEGRESMANPGTCFLAQEFSPSCAGPGFRTFLLNVPTPPGPRIQPNRSATSPTLSPRTRGPVGGK